MFKYIFQIFLLILVVFYNINAKSENGPTLLKKSEKVEKFREEAEAEKGVTWGNTGRLVFPIAIWATYENAEQAIDAANQRELYLTGIMSKKNCP